MKKIDGLKLDYRTGDASLALPQEFNGQANAFKVYAVWQWVSQLTQVGEALLNQIESKTERALLKKPSFATIADMLNRGEVIIFRSDTHKDSGKKMLVTYTMEEHCKSLQLYESLGFDSFLAITKKTTQTPSIKSHQKTARAWHKKWATLQDHLATTGKHTLTTPSDMLDAVLMTN